MNATVTDLATRRQPRHSTLRRVAAGFRAEGWRIFQSDTGRWWAQRRADWHGHELYEHADAETLVRLAAKIRGVTL